MNNSEDFLSTIQTLLPLVGAIVAALGLWHVLAKAIAASWERVRSKVKTTPSPLDDLVVDALNPHVKSIVEMIDSGNLPGAKAKLASLTVKK